MDHARPALKALLFAVSLAGASAYAKEDKPEPRPSPAGAETRAGYRSAFDGYRAFKAEEPLADWRAANETVREAGGHAGMAKQKDAPASAKGGQADHAGHHVPKGDAR